MNKLRKKTVGSETLHVLDLKLAQLSATKGQLRVQYPDNKRLSLRASMGGIDIPADALSKIQSREGGQLTPGDYEISVEGPCHRRQSIKVRVDQGRPVDPPVRFAPKPKVSGIELELTDALGNHREAEVIVDGAQPQTVSGKGLLVIPVCSRSIEVRPRRSIMPESIRYKPKGLSDFKAKTEKIPSNVLRVGGVYKMTIELDAN